jgi:hypothetical protein
MQKAYKRKEKKKGMAYAMLPQHGSRVVGLKINRLGLKKFHPFN